MVGFHFSSKNSPTLLFVECAEYRTADRDRDRSRRRCAEARLPVGMFPSFPSPSLGAAGRELTLEQENEKVELSLFGKDRGV